VDKVCRKNEEMKKMVKIKNLMILKNAIKLQINFDSKLIFPS
jgi:hypothetical protein